MKISGAVFESQDGLAAMSVLPRLSDLVLHKNPANRATFGAYDRVTRIVFPYFSVDKNYPTWSKELVEFLGWWKNLKSVRFKGRPKSTWSEKAMEELVRQTKIQNKAIENMQFGTKILNLKMSY